MALDATALVTVADLKEFSGLGGTNRDAALERAINAASREVQEYLGRKLCDSSLADPWTRTEFHTLSALTNELWLLDWPIVSATVYEDAGRAYSTALTANTDYVLDKPNGRIYRVGSGGGAVAWACGFEAIKVVGVLGYRDSAGLPAAAAPVPPDIKDAVCWIAARIFNEGERRQQDVQSVTDATGTRTSFSASRIPPHIAALLESHRGRHTTGRRAA